MSAGIPTETSEQMRLLAERCEKHARHHFTIAQGNCTETAVDLFNVDLGLECLVRAAALRARAAQIGDQQ